MKNKFDLLKSLLGSVFVGILIFVYNLIVSMISKSNVTFVLFASSIGQGLIFGMLAFYLAFIVSKQSFKMHNAGFFLLSILFFGLINALVFGILFATLSISLMYVGSILGVSFLEMALAVVITDKLVK